MSNLESNYRLYRSYFKLPALVAYLAAKNCVDLLGTPKQPVTFAWCLLSDNHRLWLAKYPTRNGGKCEALRVMGDR